MSLMRCVAPTQAVVTQQVTSQPTTICRNVTEGINLHTLQYHLITNTCDPRGMVVLVGDGGGAAPPCYVTDSWLWFLEDNVQSVGFGHEGVDQRDKESGKLVSTPIPTRQRHPRPRRSQQSGWRRESKGQSGS
ncbi:hypothetical protein E2C01_020912 [Portunus trituberculatus]|uniref:Uncharacterized protein n=1 Tax=Portunus trituberculatus TaxID=210409 RepID=A0A5B7E4Q1_PORTR|nr:hypothetical protein [Portunus trituberculatus]